MIFDHNATGSLPLAERYNVCIAGGGVAGIVLATSLARRRKRVLLLEAGGLEFSDESQELYRGESVGAPYFDLDVTRLRYLGGSSNHWGGNCRPYEEIDLAVRESIPESGWPISISDVEPYLEEACRILEIPTFSTEPTLEGSLGRLKEITLHTSPPVNFGEKYRDFLGDNDRVHVLLNANLVDIELDPQRGTVAAFAFRGYETDAETRRVHADHFVLALGGIETPRMLLSSNRQIPQGLGNETDLVGRYFMEHPHLPIGHYVKTKQTALFDGSHSLGLTAEALEQHGTGTARFNLGKIHESDQPLLYNARSIAKKTICGSDIIVDFLHTISTLKCNPGIPLGAGVLYAISEQVPNPNSRVSLSHERDPLGQRRVLLDWQLTPLDKKALRIGAVEVGSFMARRDIGRIKLFDWLLDDEDMTGFKSDSSGFRGGHHHMGTTRMGVSKHDGVVDRNCRVFGIDNFYIAGSSTFRTSGHSNPTLMIVQLTLRLANHLARLCNSL